MWWSSLLWPHSPHIWQTAKSCTGWTGWPTGSDSLHALLTNMSMKLNDRMNEQVRGHVTAQCSRAWRSVGPSPCFLRSSPSSHSPLDRSRSRVLATGTAERQPAAYRSSAYKFNNERRRKLDVNTHIHVFNPCSSDWQGSTEPHTHSIMHIRLKLFASHAMHPCW